MLEEYYDFLCERLISWAKFSDLTAGDRYVLSFENKDQVQSFLKELTGMDGIDDFYIPSDHGSGFSGLSYQLNHNNGMKLIIVSTNNVTPAYLVSLRNQIGKQAGIWDNTALLFVSDKILDSINSGAKDISRQGGPFNLDELRKNLNSEITESMKLSEIDKKSLQVMVQTVFEDEQTYTLMDFADVYAVIEKGKIESSDFNQMGYFYDDDLNTYPDIEKRLNENHDDFAKISSLHGYGDVKDRIAKVVAGDSLVNELSKDDWQDVDYRKIQSGKDRLKKQSNIKLEYLADELKDKNLDLDIWDRPEKESTSAGRRNRQIIIFNDKHLNEISFKIPFDQSVRSEWITSKKLSTVSNLSVNVSGYSIVLNFSDLDSKFPKSVQLVYKHQDKAALRFTFNIVILPFGSEMLESIHPFYKLSIKNNKSFTINLPSDIADFYIGNGSETRTMNIQSAKELNGQIINDTNILNIGTAELGYDDDLKDPFEMIICGSPVNFLLVDEETKIIPKNAVSLENFRRQHRIDGHYENEKVIFGETISSVYKSQKLFLNMETEAIKNDVLGGIIDDFEISTELKADYADLFSELRNRRTIMSLVYWDDKIVELVKNIVDQVATEIRGSEEKIELQPTVLNISHIGEYKQNNSIVFAPFNPILLSYQLQVEKMITVEILPETIQQKLNPLHLAPFLKRDDQNYKAYADANAPRWLSYSESKLSKFSDVSQSIVTERLKDFKKHFNYLFEINRNSSYNIRFVNVTDEKPILKSIVDYLIFEIETAIQKKRNINDINSVNAYIIEKNNNVVGSDFNGFYKISTNKDFEDFFSQPLKIKGVTNDEAVEVIEVIKKKLNILFGNNDQANYHITFYQFSNALTLNAYSSEKLNMNYSIDGLIGGDEYTNTQDSIKDGFGTKGLNNESRLLEFSKSWNELLVATNKRHDVMLHGQTLTNSVEELDSRTFQTQFDKSKWVTLLNPEVKLDYFNKMSNDIYVIHYTDYTNSANYESITLTKQVKQYENILSENLPKTVTKRNDQEYLATIIKSFNVINGEWLLRLVSHRNQENTVKEKLSILAVYKEMLGILNKDDVTWIPLSLEEILRVSGSFVGESRDSIFSAKSLGAKGKISDDLLFIGLWKEENQLKVAFLPTEVKVGLNTSTTIKKADIQVEKTFKVLEDELVKGNDFKSLFYLDFFMKLFFANAAKLFSNNDITAEKYTELQTLKEEIIQGNLVVDNSLTDDYKNKFVFSLKIENNNRSIQITDKYAMVEVPEADAFAFSGVKTNDVINLVQEDKFGFDKSRLLNDFEIKKDIENVTGNEYHEPTKFVDDQNEKIDTISDEVIHEDTKIPDNSIVLDDNNFNNETIYEDTKVPDNPIFLDNNNHNDVDTQENKTTSTLKTDEDHRIRLGTVDGSNNKIYWEYDNEQLANRHMLITGKSGQGKTYFIQTLLLEFAKSKIDSLVIDYTDSYLPGQLDPILEKNTKINQHIVMQEKLPINPFKRAEFSIGDYSQLENVQDVVSRVAEVMDFVFNLGIQQKSHLITIMNDGMRINSRYTFTMLKNKLLDEDELSLYGRIQPLLDNDPFSYSDDDFDWSDYFGKNGQINIIQLSRFTRTVQNAMIEFILWDLFNYSQMKSDKHLIYPIFLDEVQNLNFAADAPTVKILREGRKFGWSGIFATQSLSSIKGEVDAIYNTAEQVHFLPPENQTKVIAKTLSSERQLQNIYEQKLSNLLKGQCIVNGPVMREDGKLVKNANTINIDSLSDRL